MDAVSAMLPVVLSLGHGSIVPLVFDSEQRLEYIMTLGQQLLGLMFLFNLEFAWWEAAGLFALWLLQFIFSVGSTGTEVHWLVTYAYFAWAAIEAVRARRWRHGKRFGRRSRSTDFSLCHVSMWNTRRIAEITWAPSGCPA